MKHILEEADISLTNIHDTIQLSSPPLLLKKPLVILDLNKLPKNKTHPLTYQEKLNNIQKQQWNRMWSSSPQEKMPPKRGLHIFCWNLCNKFGT